MMEAVIPHIRLDERGVAYIGNTRSKVKQVVEDKQSGMDAEAIQAAYPHLSLAQIYAAFSYYYDHEAEMNAEIARDNAEVETQRGVNGPSPFVERLRAEGRLPR